MELSHNDFVKALREGDPAKWVLEEDHHGVGHYYRIEDWETNKTPYAKGDGPATIRRRKIREQLQKKTSKHAKPFTYRLGYNHCIGQYTGDQEYPILSGSSLNRKARKQKKPPKKPEDLVLHQLSPRSRAKVKDKGTAFFRALKQEKTFLTLTFIQDLADDLAVIILNKFLTVLRKEKRGFGYLWVAEPQEENNDRIHYHLMINRRLPIKRYNALWVLQQYNAGLVGKRANGETIPMEEIERRYLYDCNSTFRKKDPDSMMAVLNPFHIEKAYNINGLAHYLTKYVTGQKKGHQFGCLAWHCSRNVSKLFTREVVSPSTFSYLLSFHNCAVDKRTGECRMPVAFHRQYFSMVYVNNKGAPLSRLRQLEQVNRWLMEGFNPDGISQLTNDQYRKFYHDNVQIQT